MSPTQATAYTLPQLAEEADVTPRTVRYYISEGLLRSPGGGPQARYDAGHRDRIRLIKQLQRSHLPLAEIRRRLAGLTDDEVRVVMAETDAPPAGSALDYVRAALAESSPRSGVRERQFAVADAFALPPMEAAPMPGAPQMRSGTGEHTARSDPDRSHWERISLAPDIELHIRRPLTRQQNRAVGRLIGLARQLLEEDQP
jgi:DNA-binding transcriptional MerR regulator